MTSLFQCAAKSGFVVTTLIALLGVLSGCMTAGQQLDRSAVGKLAKGQTQAEVRKVFGQPKWTEIGADGTRLDFYRVTFARKVPERLRAIIVRTLCVLYDDTGQVKDFAHHVGELPVRLTHFGWEAGEPLDEGRIRNIQRELNSQYDLIYMFGQPAVVGLDRNGDARWAWYFIVGSNGFSGTGHEFLATFDSSNRVKDYVFREFQH